MWSVNPGACTAMAKLVQRQDGMLQTFVSDYQAQSSSFGFSLTGSDHLHAEVFAQTDATSRFLTFRKQDIDEYSSAGVRTNRGTGYNAATTAWSAAAWGNQIIACNYLDATQSSTGAGFSGLGGSAPPDFSAWGPPLALAASLAVAAVAGFFPARQAAHRDPAQALQPQAMQVAEDQGALAAMGAEMGGSPPIDPNVIQLLSGGGARR